MKHTLKIREIDRVVFDSIRNHEKTVETRAATAKYRKIAKGDTLVFTCCGDNLEMKVTNVELFKTIEEMAGKINFKKVMPFAGSIEAMKMIYFSFPDYEKKIEEYGLIAFYLK
jgi:ASC-1-like (ASCH) protein